MPTARGSWRRDWRRVGTAEVDVEVDADMVEEEEDEEEEDEENSSDTSSTAQGGGGSFKNWKPIGEIGCCESGMAERSH